jgi:hypothetical protein
VEHRSRSVGGDRTSTHEEVTTMTTTTIDREAEDLQALWDRMRAEAISEADRHEIDEIFSRQLP